MRSGSLRRPLFLSLVIYSVVGAESMNGETSEPFLGEAGRNKVGECLIEDAKSFRSQVDKKLHALCLTEETIEWTDASGQASVIRLADVLGATSEGLPGEKFRECKEAPTLTVFAYVPRGDGVGCKPVGSCLNHQRRAAHRAWLASDADTAERWAEAINNVLRGGHASSRSDRAGPVAGPGRRLLVLLNPVSGTGSSLRSWQNTLRPMLEQAMASLTLVVSKSKGELAAVVGNAGALQEGGEGAETEQGRGSAGSSAVTSLDAFDGIIAVGGDGTLFEVLQGLYARPDCEQQLSRLSLGIVPAGTGNGLAKTLSEESGEEFDVVGAAFLAAKGATKKMDLLHTEAGDKKYLAFLNAGWGMISDVDIESEAYRWMGSFRFTFGTFVRVANLKHYRGRISFLPAREEVHAIANAREASESSEEQEREQPDAVGAEGEGERWTSVEGKFVLLDVAQTKYISHDMPMAPASRIGDGLMDLFYIKRGAGRIAMIQMFLAMERGEHISPRYPCVTWHRVRAFRVEPLTAVGRLTVDGELVEYGPLSQRVWPKAINVMCSSASTTATAAIERPCATGDVR